MKPVKIDAIIALDSDSKVIVRNETEVDWLDSNPNNISEEEINAKLAELIVDYDAKQYQRDRQPEYPQIGNQLDMLYHAIDAGKVNKTSDFYKALKAVKDKHPKG